MMTSAQLPRVLVIDDLFGRQVANRCNEDRASLCAQYLLRDVTGDEEGKESGQKVLHPVAEAVFFRGQRPLCAGVGDVVENDLDGTLAFAAQGWNPPPGKPRWAMVLLDLCFYTGRVTRESDLRSPGMPKGRPNDDAPETYFGLTLLEAMKTCFPELPVVVLSSKPREGASRQFSSGGAAAFLDRAHPQSPELLKDYLWRYGLIPDESNSIAGHSLPVLLALRVARQAAEAKRNVLLRGPRGSGKELFARYIHRHSGGTDNRPFVVVDSGTLSPELYASTLFGHKKGAYTGAVEDRKGVVLQAHEGDLFLDEIGNMPPEVQLGLLRVLEYREVTPVGGEKAQRVDVRFLSATNEALEERAAEGRGFRSDLLDRLSEGGVLTLPPLRDRRDDIPLLVERFVREAEASNPKARPRDVDPSTMDTLMGHDWPGNVRELRSCIFNAVNRNPDIEHLFPLHIQLDPAPATAPPQPSAAASPLVPNPGLRSPEKTPDLDALLRQLSEFDFGGLRREELEARLDGLQQACGGFIAGYLRETLRATMKPLGRKVQIHPAMKMATGDAEISASKAADLVKRLLKPIEPVEDPTLREAYENAQRLRPAKSRFPHDPSQ